jgi:hypothetical protein
VHVSLISIQRIEAKNMAAFTVAEPLVPISHRISTDQQRGLMFPTAIFPLFYKKAEILFSYF